MKWLLIKQWFREFFCWHNDLTCLSVKQEDTDDPFGPKWTREYRCNTCLAEFTKETY